MFYSHEILTSREGGLATVWLVATLGSKSNLKRVNRKAIIDVNVPKTCKIIIHPEAPMALRLQSNLLYGVSRVYSQQSGYVLSDAQLAQANMLALLKAVRTSELDPNAGKARTDQIVLEDDPNFSPDMAFPVLDFDLSALDFSTSDSSRRSSILSPHSHRTSLSSQQEGHGSVLGLNIPSSGSGGLGSLGGFQLPSEHASSAQRNERLERLLEDDGEAFNIDPGFSIDAEGNLIEEPIRGSEAPQQPFRLESDSEADARVRQGLEQGLRRGQEEPKAMDLDFDMPHFDYGGNMLPDAEPFPPMAANDPRRNGGIRSPTQPIDKHDESEFAEAPLQRRRPRPRVLQFDQTQELRGADMNAWKEDYLTNMADASSMRKIHRAPSLAKKNAAIWVTGLGIGGVGIERSISNVRHPLGIFAGEAMMEMLTGVKSAPGRKRAHDTDSEGETDIEARRTRIREDDGQEIGLEDDAMPPLDDKIRFDISDGIEVGRNAPTPLADDPIFPWNTTASAIASRHGSSITRGAPGPGFLSSAGDFSTGAAGPPSLPGIQPGSLGRRGSRLTSASPLIGRGEHRYSSLEAPIGDEDELLGPAQPASDEPYQRFDNEAYESFQLHGPAAGISTQTVAQSQWIEATLDREAHNFLDFLRAEVAALPPPAPMAETDVLDEEEDELASSTPPLAPPKPAVEFEKMLPPEQHTAIVAAQALHHVLALATKGLVEVHQQEAFGAIRLSLPPGASFKSR